MFKAAQEQECVIRIRERGRNRVSVEWLKVWLRASGGWGGTLQCEWSVYSSASYTSCRYLRDANSLGTLVNWLPSRYLRGQETDICCASLLINKSQPPLRKFWNNFGIIHHWFKHNHVSTRSRGSWFSSSLINMIKGTCDTLGQENLNLHKVPGYCREKIGAFIYMFFKFGLALCTNYFRNP